LAAAAAAVAAAGTKADAAELELLQNMQKQLHNSCVLSAVHALTDWCMPCYCLLML
jgi:hypothetical protein